MPKVNRPQRLRQPKPLAVKADDNGTWQPSGVIDKIDPGLLHMAVDIATLVPDPLNARLHGERNLTAIMESLDRYGQVKPAVVRKATRVVVAGNGTMEAALALGWGQLAANVVDMTEAEAMGYGLADNRTAELAEWDGEVIKRLEQLLQDSNGAAMVGWTPEEVAVLRQGCQTYRPSQNGDSGDWQELWQGMPEFNQQDQTDHCGSVLVRFKTEADMQAFYDLVGGKVKGAKNGDSMWYPVPDPGSYFDKRYVKG